MDKLGLAPQVRMHDRQSLRFVNETDEGILQDENECGKERKSGGFHVIKLGNISKGGASSAQIGGNIASSADPS